eukprot:GHUV01032128.1.p1 GENE.GHUV01032128.1~~GHUV01032128.1.p1  ORF type:complete len:146 (-),score=58.31 GHUV01032128.1:116-553(-)
MDSLASSPLGHCPGPDLSYVTVSINCCAPCMQAWGLMELQRGNVWAAVRLLERSVDMDPFLKPVLKWEPVSIARMTVRAAGISRSSSRAAARMGCASAGAGAVSGTAGASAAAANGGKGQLSHDVSSPANSSSNSSAGGSCMSSL